MGKPIGQRSGDQPIERPEVKPVYKHAGVVQSVTKERFMGTSSDGNFYFQMDCRMGIEQLYKHPYLIQQNPWTLQSVIFDCSADGH